MELLSPAGSPEALRAAVQNGADAVYLGYGDFNARRNAKNFTAETLTEAVSYCHLRGVKVYLTLNTLLSDRELAAAAEAAALASAIGIDAVLVQDLGVWRLLQTVAPDLPLHASTQMSIHNLAGAQFCALLGMERVVLARELSRENIRLVCEKSPLEIECFGHGALCMSHSGQCYFSALLGGRSGNRGLCAQPCRLAYRCAGTENPTHPLSLKDLSLANHLQDLEALGVACVKLEGRMKRPEYVALVTGIFAKALHEGRAPTKDEEAVLETVFSRDGFTQGYYLGNVNKKMFGRRKQGDEAPEALYASARASYEGKERVQIPLTLSADIPAGREVKLTLRDEDGNEAEVLGPVPEAARNKALTVEAVAAQLEKTGGTVFACRAVTVTLDENLSLPLSALNALRRDGLAAMEALRTAKPARRTLPYEPPERITRPAPEKTCMDVSLLRFDQLSEALLKAEPDRVWLPLSQIAEYGDALAAFRRDSPGVTFGVSLPRVVTDSEWPEFQRQLESCRDLDIADALLGNWGQLVICEKLGFTLHGDYGLGVFNSLTLHELKHLHFATATASFELNLAQLHDLQEALPLTMIAYGRLPLMLLEHDLTHSGPLTDRKGEAFLILPHWGGRSELYNAKTLYLADKLTELPKLGGGLRLLFTTENAATCAAILRQYRGAEEATPPEDFTRGLYFRKTQ